MKYDDCLKILYPNGTINKKLVTFYNKNYSQEAAEIIRVLEKYFTFLQNHNQTKISHEEFNADYGKLKYSSLEEHVLLKDQNLKKAFNDFFTFFKNRHVGQNGGGNANNGKKIDKKKKRDTSPNKPNPQSEPLAKKLKQGKEILQRKLSLNP